MNKEDFLNKYNEYEYYNMFNPSELEEVYNKYDILNNDENLKMIDFLMPVVLEIKFLKTKKKDIIDNNYKKGTYDLLTNEDDKMVKKLLDSNIESLDIVNYNILLIKKTIHTLLDEGDNSGKHSSGYIADMIASKGKIEKFKGTYKLANLFDELCEILI